ncbi:MAG: nucleotidyltransferase family protein [Pseudobdellovibrionaceae bacterium]
MDVKNSLKKTILSQFHVKEEDLIKLCRDMNVKSLAIFGSITQGEFKPGKSDIDFLVEFESVTVDGFFDFLDGLKKLFHYNDIDLVTSASLKNQVIRQEILSSKEDLYAA